MSPSQNKTESSRNWTAPLHDESERPHDEAVPLSDGTEPRRNGTTPWHEDNSFWETMAPALFGHRRLAAAPVEVEQVLRLVVPSPGARVLDLCCGPGRHSLELARRGFRVTGVDRTTSYLEKAREGAGKEKLDIEFVQDDMRRFCRPDTFDFAIMMFTSFGYFSDPAQNRQVLVNLCRSLKTGGALVMEMMGKEILARIFSERDWVEIDDVILMEERKVGKEWNWIETRWILLRGQERNEFRLTLWLWSAGELSQLLRDCGFGSVAVYGDLEGAAYDDKAKRLVAVARKEK
jgi:SAM-dependent methyltransferase